MKICKSCKEEKPQGEYYYDRKTQRFDTTCRQCRYVRTKGVKDGSLEKKKADRTSINRFSTLNNWFMTEKEIADMYKTLKGHMYIRYGKWDDDVIQHTIIQGMAWAEKYNAEKASKIVWFQTILKGIFLHEYDPKLNRRIRHHYSLDWKDDDNDENQDIIMEAVNKTDEEEEDFSSINELLLNELASGKYPITKMRVDKVKRPLILEELNITAIKYKVALEEELARLEEVLSKKGMSDHLLWRRKSYIKNFIAKGGEAYTQCPVCKKQYMKFSLTGSMKSLAKVCSEECRREGLKGAWKKYKAS